MNGKNVVKTGISLYIDIMVYLVIAFIVAAVVGSFFNFLFNFEVSVLRVTVSIVWMIVFIILMYWNFKYRYVKSSTEETVNDSPEEPIKALKLRYAKGEITKEEFEQMKKDLD